MTIAPTVTVELHSAVGAPYTVLESHSGTLSTAGVGTFNFTSVANGTTFYIVVKSVNTVETWSALPQSFTSGALSYSFTTGLAQAYGTGALVLHGAKYCIFSGDLDQNGIVTSADFTGVDNDNSLGGSGANFHYVNDLDGSGIVTSSDYTFIDNNNSLGVHRQVPAGAPSALVNFHKSNSVKKVSADQNK
jgi:hypothetical protein